IYGDGPHPVPFHQNLLVDQVLHEIDHKERIAFSAEVNHLTQASGKVLVGKSGAQVAGNVFLGEVLERKFMAQTMSLEFAFYSAQRMAGEDHVDGTIGTDAHQSRGITAACQVGDQVEGGVVTPVQVFEHQKQRRIRSETLDGFGHLAQYAFTRSTSSLRLKHAALVRGYKRRHVGKPDRSVLAQNVEHLRSCGAAEPGEAIK